MPGTAAIYARFSTDLQSDRSIDDQIALCRQWAERNGYRVATTYSDRAKSGTSLIGRDGLLELLADARAGRFDTIIVEALDRLSRDQQDLAGLYKRMTFAGITIQTVHDGQADQLQVGLRGLVSGLFIADLKHKIRRGMTGVVRDGRHAGGKAYGYRPVPGSPGNLTIEESEAAVVRRIFADYTAGRSPREIAGRLNAEGVSPPRGATWNASTINGSAQRGTGILRNELYVGVLVWNRLRMVRDPDTGRRVSRINAPEAVERHEVPELAIISRETFDAAQGARRGRVSEKMTGRDIRAPRRLLSGLLRCSHCGGGMSVQGTRNGITRVRCSRATESGSCTNRRAYRLERIERAVIEGVEAQLQHPALIAEYIRAYREERMRDAADAIRDRASLERRANEVKGQLSRLLDAYLKAVITIEAFEERSAPLNTERDDLAQRLAETPTAPVIELHPQAVAEYERIASDLAGRLGALDLTEDRDTIDKFRSLIDRVVIHDTPEGGVEAEVIGRMSAVLGLPAGDVGGLMVAEEGFEPPTRGL
jgi:site-specific DNA recombinase